MSHHACLKEIFLFIEKRVGAGKSIKIEQGKKDGWAK